MANPSRSTCSRGALALGTALLVLLLAQPAPASPAQPAVVVQDPSDHTPHAVDDETVPNAAVHAFAQVGPTVYAGGRFATVRDPSGTTSYPRTHLFSFSAHSGSPTSWAPRLDGEVLALDALPSGRHLYVGGRFRHTFPDGRTRSLVRFDLGRPGAPLDETWVPRIAGGQVSDLELLDDRLVVAGAFSQKLAAVSTADGSVLPDLRLTFSGSLADNAGPVQVNRFAVDPARTRLVAIGNFTSVDGSPRHRAAMLELGPPARLSPWYYAPLHHRCRALTLPDYLRDVDFAPDGSWFVLVSTGGTPATPEGIGRDVCDAAARFATGVPAPSRPTWINYTGGDTLHSVAITGAAVYVGGHQRWLDNPQGSDTAGPGAVSRPGIGALDPTTGKALPWNPTKTRGIGTRVIHPTPTGIWFGSDGRKFGREVHDGIAFTPLP